MKYILIPIEELKECDESEYYHLDWIKSKGEIVENIPHTYGEDYKLLKTIKQ